MISGLDLFSGIGGLSLALMEWVRPVAYCEIDPYCQGVLLSRMSEGKLYRAPIWDDIRTLDGSSFAYVDIVYGGFPCQDISLAGTRKGLEGERTGLVFELFRLVEELHPAIVFLENVGGARTYREYLIQTLEEIGYECRDGSLAAAEVGAFHGRDRYWLIAYSDRKHLRIKSRGSEGKNGASEILTGESCKNGAPSNTNGQGEQQQKRIFKNERRRTSDCFGWSSEPGVCGVAYGIPNKMDRIRGLGNAVVPLQAKEAFKRLCGIGGE